MIYVYVSDACLYMCMYVCMYVGLCMRSRMYVYKIFDKSLPCLKQYKSCKTHMG